MLSPLTRRCTGDKLCGWVVLAGVFPAQPRPVSNLLLFTDNLPVTSRALIPLANASGCAPHPRGFERCLRIVYVWVRCRQRSAGAKTHQLVSEPADSR